MNPAHNNPMQRTKPVKLNVTPGCMNVFDRGQIGE